MTVPVDTLRPENRPPVTNPVAPTSRWMAAARARESERTDRLFDDPLAAALAGPEGVAWLRDMETAAWSDGPGLYPVVRTRFFDDFLVDACRTPAVRQVVLVAAGLDTRAFRLHWPRGTRVYEMDLPEVLEAKEDIIRTSEATANCRRVTVGVDLQEPSWPEALVESGYQPARPSVWLIEGLLYYLPRAAVDGLLETVRSLMTADSPIGLDVMNRWLFLSPPAWPMQAAPAWRGAPGRFGTNDPEALLARHGFDADVTEPGEQGANFGRWPTPMLRRDVPGVPRTFLVRARKS